MNPKKQSLGIIMSFALTAGQLLGLSMPVVKSLSNFVSAASTSVKPLPKKVLHKKQPVVFVKPLDPETAPHYAVVADKNGEEKIISQSPRFDASVLERAASHTKLPLALSVFEAMDKNSEFKTPENWQLLRKALIHSDNGAAELLGCRLVALNNAMAFALDLAVSDAPTFDGAVKKQLNCDVPFGGTRNFRPSEQMRIDIASMLRANLERWGMKDEFKPANGSGLPDWDRGKPGWTEDMREDSYASPKGVTAIVIKMAREHLDKVKTIYGDVGPADKPTNPFFYFDKDKNILMFCKTRSDKFQKSSTEIVVVAGDKIYAVFHPHFLKDDPYAPFPASADILSYALKKAGLDEPVLFDRIGKIKSGEFTFRDASESLNAEDVHQKQHKILTTSTETREESLKATHYSHSNKAAMTHRKDRSHAHKVPA